MRKLLNLNQNWQFTKINVGFDNIKNSELETVNVPL